MMRWKKPRVVHDINESARPEAKKGTSPLTFKPGWSPLKNDIPKPSRSAPASGPSPRPCPGQPRTRGSWRSANQLHPELLWCVQRCRKPINYATAEAEARLKLHHYGRHMAHFDRGPRIKALEDP